MICSKATHIHVDIVSLQAPLHPLHFVLHCNPLHFPAAPHRRDLFVNDTIRLLAAARAGLEDPAALHHEDADLEPLSPHGACRCFEPFDQKYLFLELTEEVIARYADAMQKGLVEDAQDGREGWAVDLLIGEGAVQHGVHVVLSETRDRRLFLLPWLLEFLAVGSSILSCRSPDIDILKGIQLPHLVKARIHELLQLGLPNLPHLGDTFPSHGIVIRLDMPLRRYRLDMRIDKDDEFHPTFHDLQHVLFGFLRQSTILRMQPLHVPLHHGHRCVILIVFHQKPLHRVTSTMQQRRFLVDTPQSMPQS
mmetsp:Transcript_24490/g.68254  ORF Transcript_24490/g.68254 Transcript_24490/m.68254 type:complete len:307 (-) Transcript_24490:35-955(-)